MTPESSRLSGTVDPGLTQLNSTSCRIGESGHWLRGGRPTLKSGSRCGRLPIVEAKHTIGQLARAAGVPISTVRYYERRRLLEPDDRTAGNYRVYGTEALKRLRFIRAAQANGFTLEDVATLLRFRDGQTAPCEEVQALIEERLSHLARQREELRHVEAVLRASLQTCRQAERSGRCKVIDRLDVASSPAAAKGRRRAPARKSKDSAQP